MADLLDTATKITDAMCELFPHVNRLKLKNASLVYLLKNSTVDELVDAANKQAVKNGTYEI